VARSPEGRTPGGGRPALRAHVQTLGITLSLVLLVIAFTAAGSGFVNPHNLQTMAAQSVIISLGAIGMTLVIVSGGIDLSVGSAIALSMVVTAWCIEAGMWLWAAAVCGVLTGGVVGLLNGAMITAFRLVPFIATLGMMGMARGLAKLIARSQQINLRATHRDWDDLWLAQMTVNPGASPHVPEWLLVAPVVWLLVALAALMALVLRHTVFGRHVFAIGSSEAAARLCGVRVSRTKVIIYTVAGLFTGLAGVVFVSRQSQGDPTAALAYELDIIAAVVIGGGSLRGGEGSILGSLVGALIMIVLRSGLTMVNAPAPVQEILIGAVIIVAVIVDQLQHRGKE
jgi:ribose transport system permease protein